MAKITVSALLVLSTLVGVAVQFTAPAWGETAMSCEAPLETNGEWPASSPEEAGLDSGLICSLNAMLDKSPELNVHAIVVVRGGKLVYESYRAGDDDKWGTKLGVTSYTPQMQHDQRSISKSVVSLLFGIALDRKLIARVDEPVFKYFPELDALRTSEKDGVLLSELLTMTSGLAWDERRAYSDPNNSERKMIASTEPYRFVLEQPVQHKSGEVWNYSGGNTQLLAGVLQRTTGKRLTDFAKEALFDPLGIAQFEWLKMPANGEVAAASGLRLRPRDMAKLGELVLQKGVWRGHRIISKDWIEESTRPHISGFHQISSIAYGYQWWIDWDTISGKRLSWISAQGYGGQRIYVVPAYNLVVVITAGLYGSESGESLPYEIFSKYILNAIRQ